MPETTAKYHGLRATIPPATRNQTFVKDILVASTISILPLLAFSALLLGLVARYRITPRGHDDPRIPDVEGHWDRGILYINLSATVFTTVSSWSSTVAPLSLPFILAIASFLAARILMRASNGGKGQKLPTPYQIALLLRVMSNSSLSSVWHCMVYMFAKPRRAPISSALNVMICTLILGTIQSMLIFATDTWLHFTTETVPITQFHPTTYPNASFGVPSNCTIREGRTIYECDVFLATDSEFDSRSRMVQQALANTSDRAIIHNYDQDGRSYAYIAPPTSSLRADVDYAAATFAATSNCTPATSRCFKRDDLGDKQTHYKCDFAMEGTIDTSIAVSTSDLQMTAFANSTLSSDDSETPDFKGKRQSSALGDLPPPNPYQFGVLVSVTANLGYPEYADDDEVFSNYEQATIVVLLCQSTVFNVEYASVNGSIIHFLASPSNLSTTDLIARVMLGTVSGNYFLLQRTISHIWASSTAQQVADRFAYTYSQALLATSNIFIESRPAEIAQQRSSVLVAAVPVTPLVCLLIANVLVVLLAIILTAGALMEVARCEEVGDVQEKLSIDALVAAHFEPSGKEPAVRKTQDMFQEYQGEDGPRVKVQKTAEDGWKLVSCDS